MSIWNSGSIALHVGNMFGWSNMPSNISGTTLNNMIEQEIIFVENFTSDSIDSTNIPEKYQPAIIDLTYSKLLLTSEAQQGGVDNVSLGGLSVSQAGGGGAELAKQLRGDAITRLTELQRTVRFKRVLGV
jgi:hypothetical protein